MSATDGTITHSDFLQELQADPAFRAAWAVEQSKAFLAANTIRLRKERGLTQAHLARAAGMRQPRVAEIERGDANPTLETVSKIAHALETSADALLADPGKIAPEAHGKRQTARASLRAQELPPYGEWNARRFSACARGEGIASAANDNFALAG